MSNLVIKQHRPGYWIGWGAVLTLLMVAGNYGLFLYFTQQQRADARALGSENLRVVEERQRLELENRELRDTLAVLERGNQVEHEAYLQHVQTVKELQAEVVELKRQLTFYQELTSAESLQNGVSIEKFILSAGKKPRQFHFLLMLTRVLKSGSVSDGTARLAIHGLQGGEPMVLELAQISPASGEEIAFKFKYFQNLEGELALPEGFEPQEVHVRVTTGGKKTPPLEEVFDWSVEE